MNFYRMGIDVGSTTTKLVLIDEQGHADVSKVNFFNRLYFFVDQAKTTGRQATRFQNQTKAGTMGARAILRLESLR